MKKKILLLFLILVPRSLNAMSYIGFGTNTDMSFKELGANFTAMGILFVVSMWRVCKASQKDTAAFINKNNEIKGRETCTVGGLVVGWVAGYFLSRIVRKLKGKKGSNNTFSNLCGLAGAAAAYTFVSEKTAKSVYEHQYTKDVLGLATSTLKKCQSFSDSCKESISPYVVTNSTKTNAAIVAV